MTRILMLMGAEIILAQIGGLYSRTKMFRYDSQGNAFRNRRDLDSWQCIARARAAENLVYVITTTNVFFKESTRGAFVAGPEETLALSEGPGIVYATLDKERLWYLRSKYFEEEDLKPLPEDPATHKSLLCLPGINHERRPELYGKLTESQPDTFDYFYARRGLGAWRGEYDKIKKISS